MKTPKICKRCQTYLLDHKDPQLFYLGWKQCPHCNWCCDKEGYNLINKKEENNEQEEDSNVEKRVYEGT